MKTIKSVLTATAIAALFASSVFAAEPLASPRATGSAHKVTTSEVKDVNYLRDSTTTGNSAKGKVSGNRVVASSTKADPNLLACAKIGKATCDKNPCDGTMAAACCKK